jgi:hypothetical protein
MIGHPREDQLLAFQDHRLDDQRRRRLAGHLSGCQRCRNVVQAHRTVRGVFALEAPFAPDGVLERVLASRAAGTIVMLPVAEPDARRPMELPSRGFLIAVGLVLTVGISVQVVPANRFQQVWGAWSAMVTDWEPFAGQSVINVHYPLPPVARGAVIDPARTRPMRVRYRYNDLNDGQVRSSTFFSLELDRLPDGWSLNVDWPGHYQVGAHLGGTLEPQAWTVLSRFGTKDEHVADRRFTVRGDSISVAYRPTLAASTVLPNHPKDPFDSTYFARRRMTAPYALDQAHLFVLFASLPIRKGWVGSIYNGYSPRYWRLLLEPPTTYLTVGDETITTPIGRYETWEVTELSVGPVPYSRFWINKADGLLVKYQTGNRWGHEIVLESVTYP